MNHWSDCAVHNEPALPAGECDCGVEIERLRQENNQLRDELRKALHGDSCLCDDCFKPLPHRR
jgi:hypothetical protein